MIKNKLSVYRYHDYRRYFEDMIKTNSADGLTLRKFSKMLNISPSYLSQVIRGKKDFSPDILSQFKKTIKLDKHEMKHLAELLSLSRSENQKQKIEVYNEIIKDKKYQKNNPDEHAVYSYLGHWFFVALKEYFALCKEVTSYAEIKKHFIFKLKDSEIKKALKFLINEKFIAVDKNSKVTILKEQVDCYNDIYRLSLASFHKQMFNLAIESIHLVDRDERLILGNTIGVSKEGFLKIRQIIQNAHEAVRQIEIEDQNKDQDQVYHVGLAVFPITQKRGPS